MTAIVDILESAFFEGGLTTELQHATPTQMTNAMQTLSTLIAFLYGSSLGEYLQEWPLGNYGRSSQSKLCANVQQLSYPGINARLVAVNDDAMNVYFPADPSDGARMGISDPFGRLATFPVTLDGNGRTIDGAATQTLDTNGASTIWLYRADLGNWVPITPLLVTGDMPFPEEYDQLFIIMMAMRLNPIYGRNISSVQAQFLKEFRQQFTARYVQSAPLELGYDLVRMSRKSTDTFANGGTFSSSQDAWNRGWGY